MATEWIIATTNKGKIVEFTQILEKPGRVIKSLLDYQEIPEIVEDGKTFAENAMKKARTAAQHLGKVVIADDSGLIVDELDGRPGIFFQRAMPERRETIRRM